MKVSKQVGPKGVKRVRSAMMVGLATLLLSTQPSDVRGSFFAGATEVTQLLNNSQLILQVEETVKLVTKAKDTLTYLKSLNSAMTSLKEWGQYESALATLAASVRQGKETAFALEQSQRDFRRRYGLDKRKGGSALDYQHERWWRENTAMVDGVLGRVGLRAQDFDDERRGIAKVLSMSRTQTRRDDILKAANELAGAQSVQLQRLREIGLAQVKMQGEVFAATEAREYEAEDAMRRALARPGRDMRLHVRVPRTAEPRKRWVR